jgi:hypothetical protein
MPPHASLVANSSSVQLRAGSGRAVYLITASEGPRSTEAHEQRMLRVPGLAMLTAVWHCHGPFWHSGCWVTPCLGYSAGDRSVALPKVHGAHWLLNQPVPGLQC